MTAPLTITITVGPAPAGAGRAAPQGMISTRVSARFDRYPRVGELQQAALGLLDTLQRLVPADRLAPGVGLAHEALMVACDAGDILCRSRPGGAP